MCQKCNAVYTQTYLYSNSKLWFRQHLQSAISINKMYIYYHLSHFFRCCPQQWYRCRHWERQWTWKW